MCGDKMETPEFVRMNANRELRFLCNYLESPRGITLRHYVKGIIGTEKMTGLSEEEITAITLLLRLKYLLTI